MNRDVLRFGVRAALFTVAVALFHAGVVAVAIRIVPEEPLSAFTNVPRAGIVGQARLMAEEAADAGKVDILFLGSSHAYRTFDPRFFSRSGLRVFTLGSSGVTPAQAYYLQRMYMPDMRPDLVIYEAWWNSLAGIGEGPAMNLTANLPMSFELIRMNLEARNIVVYGGLLRRVLGGAASDPRKHVPDVSYGRYIGRGFVEQPGVFTGAFTMAPWSISMRKRQMEYLARIIHDARDQGSDVALVVQPIPRELLDRIENYPELDSAMRSFAARNGVPYIDFNQLMQMDARVHFANANHLNAAGVEAFLTRLMPELERRGLLEGLADSSAKGTEGT